MRLREINLRGYQHPPEGIFVIRATAGGVILATSPTILVWNSTED